MQEFDLINRYFKSAGAQRDDVELGIGDDCALLSPPPGKLLAVSTDTLISGVHFPVNTSPEDIGYKSLAVNLSDLAAMGAQPAWVSLAISLPSADEDWVKRFMQGFSSLAQEYGVALVGGDTTRGALSITVSITGFVDSNTNFTRSNACEGDAICVTGTLGDAAAGLRLILDNDPRQSHYQALLHQLNRPQPQLPASQLLQPYRIAAIDLSDGLLADLGHICERSGCGAVIELDSLPVSQTLREYYADDMHWKYLVNAGDDYQLCFCCDDETLQLIQPVFKQQAIQLTRIGVIRSQPGIRCLQAGREQAIDYTSGYNHFKHEN